MRRVAELGSLGISLLVRITINKRDPGEEGARTPVERLEAVGKALFGIALLAWLALVILIMAVGSPKNLSTDPNEPLVKSGRIRYISPADYHRYNRVRGYLALTMMCAGAGGAIAFCKAKMTK